MLTKTQQKVFLIFLILSSSCDSNEKPPSHALTVLTELKRGKGSSYAESLKNWNLLKQSNGNSYIYQTTVTSWTGYGSTTELRIENGVITSRIYQEFTIDQNDGTKSIIDSYIEHSNSLGTHTKGASLFTIDDLYDTCAKDYLIADQENNTIYFETEERGLMTICGFVPDGCMDDCFNGLTINSFDWL